MLLVHGIKQRADLLEKLMADFYGPADLIRTGVVPPGLIAGNPEFLRPLVGVRPASGSYLHFCAFELGRGPDGRWWVLGDRTQAPSGAGFALENRVATARALPEIYGQLHVHRLAGFFGQFRDALMGQITASQERAAILTPGPLNETYFEHAYIARYLGISLLEGEDMVVEGGELMVRTVAGLKPVKVLWRRLDASFADPLELNQTSEIGTPGLLQALRAGTVSLVNALGSGVLETRALNAFLPSICKHLTGSDLELPSLATWWCGGDKERQYVRDNLDEMMIGPALSTKLPFEDARETSTGAQMNPEERAAMIARLETDGAGIVGQEAVSLSTTPVFVGGHLEPRPVVLRVYAARTPDGWTVMPGGFARVGYTLDTAALSMQQGGQAADVWVVSNKPVPQETLLTHNAGNPQRNTSFALPSRAADNLMWMGRYIERCEFTTRILRAYHLRLADAGDLDAPLLREMRAHLLAQDVDAQVAIPHGLVSALQGAVGSASRIRDRFSPDGWLALSDLEKTLQDFGTRVQPGDDAARAMTVLLRKLAGFAGLVHENMYRFSGWRFLEIGRRMERSTQMVRLCAHFIKPDAPLGALDMLLEVADSVMTHRRRYNIESAARTVIELLVLDPLNPRSAHFQLTDMREQIAELPQGMLNGQMAPTTKEAVRLQTELALADPADVTPKFLNALAASLNNLATLLAMTYHG